MELSDVEIERKDQDRQLDGFFDFVDVERIGKYRIVHRETKPWLGIVDNLDNILVPLIYDGIEHRGHFIRTMVKINEEVFYGVANVEDGRLLMPAKYKTINQIANNNVLICYDGKNWAYFQLDKMHTISLPVKYLPLDNKEHLCVLHKHNEDTYKIECWNENQNHSEYRLRLLALDSKCPNRIKLTNTFLGLVVYADIYGQVLFANKDLSALFR